MDELLELRRQVAELRGREADWKRVEETLRENEAKFHAIVNAFDGLIYVCSSDYRIEYMNEPLIERTGYDATGEPCFKALHNRSDVCPWCVNERVFRGETVRWEVKSPKDQRWYYIVNSPIYHPDGTISKQAMITDINERKENEEELRRVREELELRVQERTAELTTVNQALKASESQLRILSSRLLEAQEEERKRIAHELHDSIGASLGAIKFSLVNTLDAVQEGAAVQESIQDLLSLVEHTVEDARRIYTNLRPSMLDHLGIIPTIGWYCRQFESAYTSIPIEKHIEVEEEEIPDSIKIVIFRVIQESFHNIAKYSRADRVRLFLSEASGRIELAVSDNGVGFDVDAALTLRREKGGLGLTSMRERVQLSGGAFAIESAPGSGTTIRASWDPGKAA
jgi:PAS domain S-box-containing protein